MDCVNFSAHYLLWLFAHKKAVTVSELSDYITRRKKNKKSQYLNEAQNGCTRSRIRIGQSKQFIKINNLDSEYSSSSLNQI